MKNQKINLLIVSVFTIIVCSMSLKTSAQTLKDYQGIWHATDKSGNVIELQLNANYSCSYKINGVASYEINAYKMVSSNSDNSSSTQSPKMDIWFYTNSTGSTSQNINSTPVAPSKIIYKGSTKISGDLFSKLELKVGFGPATENITELMFSK